MSLVPDPAAVAYGIEGQDPVEGGVDLTVLSGADVFTDDVADCAELADAQLASVPVEGSTVNWDASGLTAHASQATATAAVDDLGTAGMSYEMTTESQEDAQNGDPVSAQMSVNAWVDRAEMAQLAAVVKSILLGDAAGSPAGRTVQALYQAMEPTLNTVMRPSGFAVIDVTYHQPAASPSPSQAESDVTGTWDGTWVIDGYGNTGDFTMELVQSGDDLQRYGREHEHGLPDRDRGGHARRIERHLWLGPQRGTRVLYRHQRWRLDVRNLVGRLLQQRASP